MISATLLLLACVFLGATVLALGLCAAAGRGDRAYERHMAEVVDLKARRDLAALRRAVERHPSGRES